ncbi:hypothetical protein BD310DRAFT_572983 [Dichomitus squalens]|uniref:Uncharacterized protein n=1 Tax=Dichomitus squalens TaxID=114155 RepID=A0A4Q9PRP4_9APHY|nr:hypothetical protein BD310DRAFT_572983 [Dichomitus squalens]
MTQFYPAFHGEIHTSSLPLGQRFAMRVILKELPRSRRADMAFRCLNDARTIPLSGRVVKPNGIWVWEASFTNWAVFFQNERVCKEVDVLVDVVSRLRSGYQVIDLLDIAQTL